MIDFLVAILGPVLKVRPTPPHIPKGALDPVVFRASERYLSYRYLLASVQIVPMFAAAAVFAVSVGVAGDHGKPAPTAVWAIFSLVLVGVVLGAAFSLVGVRLDWEFHRYVMTDRCVRIRRGVWEQVEATLTYANVQNVRVVQGPLERLFGIASVVVDTAGSAGRTAQQDPMLKHHRGVIRGIADAHALRDRIMERMRQGKSSGLGDPDEAPEAEPETEATLLRAVREQARGLAADLRGRGPA